MTEPTIPLELLDRAVERTCDDLDKAGLHNEAATIRTYLPVQSRELSRLLDELHAAQIKVQGGRS